MTPLETVQALTTTGTFTKEQYASAITSIMADIKTNMDAAAKLKSMYTILSPIKKDDKVKITKAGVDTIAYVAYVTVNIDGITFDYYFNKADAQGAMTYERLNIEGYTTLVKI
jgi:hypothetical protein